MFYLCFTVLNSMKLFLSFFFLLSFHVDGQLSKNVTLLDNWYSDTIIANSSLVRFSDCWGYSQNGEEYAMLGSTEGTHYFHIVNDQLIHKDFIPGNFISTTVVHRDLKTYLNYAYLVCDEGPSKLQIVDLSYLPDSVHLVAELETNFGRVHNLFIDSVNALMYACMVTPIVNGNPTSLISMRVFSLADPVNPQLVYQGPNDIPEVHDCYVRDNIAILNCGFDGMRVYDFTNPASPIFIQNIEFYQDQGYNHQGWLTPDGKHYIFGDETNGMRLKKWTFSENQLTASNLFGTNYQSNSVPHNIMATNEYAFVAYYNEGLRIYDIRSTPKEVAFYDTYPTDFFYKMNGAWGIYSELPSQRLLVSDRQNGLFLLDFDRSALLNSSEDVFVYPTIVNSSGELTIQLEVDLSNNFEVQLFAVNGDLIQTYQFYNQTYGKVQLPVNAGIYFVKVKYIDYLEDEISVVKKIVVY